METVGVSPHLADHNCYMRDWWLLFNGGFGAEGESVVTHALDLITKERSEQADSRYVPVKFCWGKRNQKMTFASYFSLCSSIVRSFFLAPRLSFGFLC